MADEPTGEPLSTEDAEGGPVKPFLEHLEDLRWTLIKVATALGVAMMVCLVGGKHLVHFLTHPLRQATELQAAVGLRTAAPAETVPVYWGTNIVAEFARANLADTVPGASADTAAIRVVPQRHGDAVVLALQPEKQSLAGDRRDMVALKNYSPLSAFMVAIKLALYGGLVLSLPFILYFIGQFVLPALRVREREFVLRALGFGVFLFLLGVAFCYFVILQVALTAAVQFSDWLGFSADEWRAEDYISFVCMFMLVMGLSFQLPVVLLALVKVGVLDHISLSKHRAYWVVAVLVVCAFLTPSGDPFTMFLMAAPLHLLYEICTAIAWYWHWRDERAARRAAGAA